MTAVLLAVTALIAYAFGNVRTIILASHVVFHRDLLMYTRDNLGITRFLKDYKWKGFAILGGMELCRTLLPVLIGGWLMSIVEQPDIGRAFALFCVMLGTIFPVVSEFRGESGLFALLVGAFGVKMELGILILVIFAVVYFASRYISLAALVSAVMMYIMTIVLVDAPWVHTLVLLCMALIFISFRRNIVALVKGKEKKFIYKKDLSYMFDDK